MVSCQFPGGTSSPLWRAFSTTDSTTIAVYSKSETPVCVLITDILDLLPWEEVRVEGRLFCDLWPILASDWPCPTTSVRLFPQSGFLCTSQFKTSVRYARSRQEPYFFRLLCIFPLPSLISHWVTSTLFFNRNMKYIFIEKTQI